MKLAASVIVRNELSRYLEPFLAHLFEFCDLVCVLDDGSSDRWEEALRPGFGKSVLVESGRTRMDATAAFSNHAAARNQLLSFTLSQEPSHILAIDADEFVADGQALRRACERSKNVMLSMEECWELCDDCVCVREDGGWASHPITMAWAPQLGARYGIRDLGHATGRIPSAVGGGVLAGEVLHLGWANRAERAERFQRYADGDAGKYHARAHIDSIMWPDEEVTCRARPWPAALEPWQAELLRRANGAKNIPERIPA